MSASPRASETRFDMSVCLRCDERRCHAPCVTRPAESSERAQRPNDGAVNPKATVCDVAVRRVAVPLLQTITTEDTAAFGGLRRCIEARGGQPASELCPSCLRNEPNLSEVIGLVKREEGQQVRHRLRSCNRYGRGRGKPLRRQRRKGRCASPRGSRLNLASIAERDG